MRIKILPDVFGILVAIAAFIGASYWLLSLLAHDWRSAPTVLSKLPTVAAAPFYAMFAAVLALIAWECASLAAARFQFTDEQFSRFVQFRYWGT